MFSQAFLGCTLPIPLRQRSFGSSYRNTISSNRFACQGQLILYIWRGYGEWKYQNLKSSALACFSHPYVTRFVPRLLTSVYKMWLFRYWAGIIDTRIYLWLGNSRFVTSVPQTTSHFSVTTCQCSKHQGAELNTMQMTRAPRQQCSKRCKHRRIRSVSSASALGIIREVFFFLQI